MRSCPFAGCTNKVSGSNFCCQKHWHSMKREYRDRAFNLFKRFADREIKLNELIGEQEKIADECEFTSERLTGETIDYACGKCEKNCFLVTFGSLGTIVLDSLHSDDGEYVVVGGVAYSGPDAERRILTAPALAKLCRHVCSGSRCQQVPYEACKKGVSDAGHDTASRRAS